MAPLAGVRVLDLSRLAPGPYCTMLLADLGAEVIVVEGGRAGVSAPQLSRGKKHITLDLKSDVGRAALHRLVPSMDVVVEGFRPGVAARIGAGREELTALKSDLVYCSVTGYGQAGQLANVPGHDINYLSLTGALGAFGPISGAPVAPLNLLADFAGGGMVAALGIVAALRSRDTTGSPQFVDAAMVDGVMSLMTMHYPDWGSPALPERGRGLLGGEAPFYRCYECADGRFIAVGALEKQFFSAMWTGLELPLPIPDHFDQETWRELEETLGARFRSETRDHWESVFSGTDACVTPVLSPDEVWAHPHVGSRLPKPGVTPAIPSIQPSMPRAGEIDMSDHTQDVLLAVGMDPVEVEAVVNAPQVPRTGLSWPPTS